MCLKVILFIFLILTSCYLYYLSVLFIVLTLGKYYNMLAAPMKQIVSPICWFAQRINCTQMIYEMTATDTVKEGTTTDMFWYNLRAQLLKYFRGVTLSVQRPWQVLRRRPITSTLCLKRHKQPGHRYLRKRRQKKTVGVKALEKKKRTTCYSSCFCLMATTPLHIFHYTFIVIFVRLFISMDVFLFSFSTSSNLCWLSTVGNFSLSSLQNTKKYNIKIRLV